MNLIEFIEILREKEKIQMLVEEDIVKHEDGPFFLISVSPGSSLKASKSCTNWFDISPILGAF